MWYNQIIQTNHKNMDNNNHPVTKKELDQALNDWTYTEIAPTVELIFEKHQDKIVNEVKKIKDEIVKSNDTLAGVIKTQNEELMAKIMGVKQAEDKFEEINVTLADHGRRLGALELQPA